MSQNAELTWDDLGMSELLPTGTVTLLLADVEGSTRLWETQPEQMTAALAQLNRTVNHTIAAHDGVRPLEQGEGDSFVAAFARSGFRGGLNYYRNLDRNWALQAALKGRTVDIPALYVVGDRDVGLSMPGMREIVAAMPTLAPGLEPPLFLEACGHWAPQESPERVSAAIIEFARRHST